MKTKFTIGVLLIFLAIAIPGRSFAPVAGESSNAASEAQRLINRLEEIKAMDKTNMPRNQKRALRAEVKATQKKLKDSGGGIYLSAGAVILIIVLLIIFL